MGTDALIHAGSRYLDLVERIGKDAVQALLDGRAAVVPLEGDDLWRNTVEEERLDKPAGGLVDR